jgi:hypothetical protein
MMTTVTSTPNLASVVQVPPVGRDGLLDYRWRRFFDAISKGLPPLGAGTVIDGTNGTYAQMTLFQGPDSAKSGTPATGDIYLALDTGRIYWANSGTWNILSEELTGDVTKPANSTVTSLANVFSTPGTYGSATQTPVITIDAKGRVTNLWFETVSTPPFTPVGPSGALQFNDGGVLNGTALIFYNPSTGGFVFSNPAPTREALSPLTTKGDIFVRSSTVSTRLPVGTNGQTLVADSSTATGLVWANSRTVDIPFQFNVVNPFPLVTVPANVRVKQVTTYLETAFDGTGATLTIGDAGDPDRLQDNIDPYEAVAYQSTVGYQYGVNTPIFLFINAGTATQGDGLISIQLQERA